METYGKLPNAAYVGLIEEKGGRLEDGRLTETLIRCTPRLFFQNKTGKIAWCSLKLCNEVFWTMHFC